MASTHDSTPTDAIEVVAAPAFSYEYVTPVRVTLGNRTRLVPVHVSAVSRGNDLILTVCYFDGRPCETRHLPHAAANARSVFLPAAFGEH